MTRTNLHIYPAPILNESRIFKQTLSVAESRLFDRIVICGTARADLPSTEAIGLGRTIERIGSVGGPRKRSVLARVWEQLAWSRAVYKRYASSSAISVINAHSVAVLPVAYFLSRRIGATLIYDTHELETETLASRGAQRKIFKAIERLFVGKCNAIFVVNDSISNWYGERYPNLKPVVVRNVPGVQLQDDVVTMRELLAVDACERIFIHVGNLTGGRNIEAILQAFTSKGVQDHLVFLGSGELEEVVRSVAEVHSNVHHLSAVPPGQVLSYVAGCDAALCLIEPVSLSLRFSLPNKAFEYAAAGVPFFYTDLVEINSLLGPEFSFWRLRDPSEDLAPALKALTSERVTEARKLLSELKIPTWEQESLPMVAKYAELVGLPKEAR